jgi:hypothetical protein
MDSNMKGVEKAAKKMVKDAGKDGRDADEAFPSLWTDLARERARNT